MTNSHTPEVTSVTVKKVWDDEDDQDGLRPESVTVKLLADGKDTGKSVELSESNKWTGSFTELDVYKAGEEIVYTVEEDEVADYEVAITGDASEGFTVTNTHEPEKTEVSVTKVWDDEDDADGIRPSFVNVQLYADGEEEGSVVSLTEDNGWTYTWTDLPSYASGKAITYTVDEVAVPDEYVKTVSGSAKEGFIITNTHEPDEEEESEESDKPDTGDHNDLAGLLGLLGISAAGLGALYVRRKREQE